MSVLDVSMANGLATITLNRPEAMNALNDELKAALADFLRSARSDPSVRAVLLRGSGKAFCAGGDLTEMDPRRTPEQARARQDRLMREVFLPLAQFPRPVVAAVHAHAHGAGLCLALACDVVVVGTDTPMSLGFVNRGLAPDCGALYFVPRLVGTARAKELMLTGRRFDGAEAAAMGLVAHAVRSDEVHEKAEQIAHGLAEGASVALGLTKSLVDRSWSMSLDELADAESMAAAVTRATRDHAEAIEAFSLKRDARFTGE